MSHRTGRDTPRAVLVSAPVNGTSHNLISAYSATHGGRNHAQVTNRDLSIAVLRTFLPQLSKELKDRTIKRNKGKQDKQPGAQMQSVAGIKPNEASPCCCCCPPASCCHPPPSTTPCAPPCMVLTARNTTYLHLIHCSTLATRGIPLLATDTDLQRRCRCASILPCGGPSVAGWCYWLRPAADATCTAPRLTTSHTRQ
jgi:hypothetical protein